MLLSEKSQILVMGRPSQTAHFLEIIKEQSSLIMTLCDLLGRMPPFWKI